MKYKQRLAYLAMVFMALVACSAKDSQTGKPGSPLNSNRALERALAQIAGQANGAAPANIDENTRLDGAKAGPGLRLTTNYTLLNPESDGITTETFATKLTPVVTDGGCKNPELRPLISQGVVVALEYRGPTGDLIGTVSLNRATCGMPKSSP